MSQTSHTQHVPQVGTVSIHADRAAGRLEIGWPDGHATVYDTTTLRWLCPCAFCRGEAGMPGWLDSGPTLTAEQTRLVDVAMVGGYAIAPTWGDGHHTGYYTYALLRTRCPCVSMHRATPRRFTGDPAPPTDPPRGARMIVVTTPFLAGHRVVESKGMVFGLVVRSRGLGGNIMAGLRSLGGGEIHEYTSLLEDTRRQALDRLVKNATLLGANAVLSMRFDSSELSGTMSEIVAYGTAVDRRAGPGARRAGDGRLTMALRLARALRRSSSVSARWSRSAGWPIVAEGGTPGTHRRPGSSSCGLVLIVGAVIERIRYRSESAERVGAVRPDPAAANPTDEPLEGRFRRTDEVFVDPTSGHRMRVWLDPATGERRYRAEE